MSDLLGPVLDEALLAQVVDATRAEPLPSLWCKVVGMLQQNWAIVLEGPSCIIVFCDDRSGVFDARYALDSLVAIQQLEAQGFEPHRPGDFPPPPTGAWHLSAHPSGRIYATGCFWMS